MHVQHCGPIVTLPTGQSHVYGHSAGTTELVIVPISVLGGPCNMQVEGLHSDGTWAELSAPVGVATGVLTPISYAGCFRAIRISNSSLGTTFTGYIASRNND